MKRQEIVGILMDSPFYLNEFTTKERLNIVKSVELIVQAVKDKKC